MGMVNLMALCVLLIVQSPTPPERPQISWSDHVTTFDPRMQRRIQAHHGETYVELVPGNPNRLLIRDAHKRSFVRLPPELVQIDSIQVCDSKRVIVIGMVNGSGS